MVELCRKIEYFLVCGKAVAEYEKEETPMKGIVKKAGFTLIVILLLDVLVFPVAAKEIRDDCNALTPGQGIQYINLGEASSTVAGIGSSDFPDSTALGLQNCGKEGVILLEAPQAQSITVSIYSQNKGTYGVSTANGCIVGSSEAGPRQELLFSAGSGKVYLPTGEGKGKEMVYHRVMAAYTFPNEEVPLPKDTIRYGLNVYASLDGTAYQGTCGVLYYETYQGSLPEGSCFLKIAVNDFSSIATEKGAVIQNIIQYPVGIANFSVMLPDDPPPKEPEVPPAVPSPKPPSQNGSINLRPPNEEKPKGSSQETLEEEETTGITHSFGGNISAPYYYSGMENMAQEPQKKSAAQPQPSQTVQGVQPSYTEPENVTKTLPKQNVALEEAPAAGNIGTAAAAAAVAGASATLLFLALGQKGMAAYKHQKQKKQPLEGEKKDSSI